MSHRVTYVDSLRSALHEVMERDPSVVVLGEDILDPYGGSFTVTRGLSTRFPGKVFTTPICEATITGMAVGLALRGFRPVAEIMFGDFITLATDQIINHAAKFGAMYNGQLNVPLVIRTPMGGGRGYGPTHSQSLERLFFGVPHLKVVAPSHFHDPGALLRDAITDPFPVLFVENKLLYPQVLVLGGEQNELECMEVKEQGAYPTVLVRNYSRDMSPDVTIIAYGGISRLLAPLMVRLAKEEIRVLACLPGCLSPLADEHIIACAAETGRVVIVEEGCADFGWGAEVGARIHTALQGQLRGPIRRVGAAPTVIPASRQLEEKVLVSEEVIQSAVLEVSAW